MIRRICSIWVGILLLFASACSKQHDTPELIVEIPAGFSGNFVLEMGDRSAEPLVRDGDTYRVTVPRTGKVVTSTVLERPKVKFNNSSGGSIWGYSESMFTTGDGISVGGKIEFFVGTQKDFDAEQNRKNHSGKSHRTMEESAAHA